MDTQPITHALPKCNQIVTKYTYQNRKVHDVILTNMSHLYALPFVVPAVQTDIPGGGVPSDHDMAVAVPLAGAGAGSVTRAYTTRTSRPMPDSAVRKFGQWITAESWAALRNTTSASHQGLLLKHILQGQVDDKFPTKEVRMSNTDKPWVTQEIKKLDRWKKTRIQKAWKKCQIFPVIRFLQFEVPQCNKAAPEEQCDQLDGGGPREGLVCVEEDGGRARGVRGGG